MSIIFYETKQITFNSPYFVFMHGKYNEWVIYEQKEGVYRDNIVYNERLFVSIMLWDIESSIISVNKISFSM